MAEETYKGPERRRFRRIDLEYPVRIEPVGKSEDARAAVLEGVTLNLSFGGALVGVADTSGLQGALPVRFSFPETHEEIRPPDLSAVVWRLEGDEDATKLGVEFAEPLLAFEGSVELDERLVWLSIVGGEEFRDDIVAIFLDNVPETIRRACDSQERGDLAGVVQAARSLKSSCGDIGAVSLYEVARRAEQAAFQGDAATVAQMVERLDAYFDAVRAELKRRAAGRRS